jgi:hypothetical protein
VTQFSLCGAPSSTDFAGRCPSAPRRELPRKTPDGHAVLRVGVPLAPNAGRRGVSGVRLLLGCTYRVRVGARRKVGSRVVRSKKVWRARRETRATFHKGFSAVHQKVHPVIETTHTHRRAPIQCNRAESCRVTRGLRPLSANSRHGQRGSHSTLFMVNSMEPLFHVSPPSFDKSML